MRHTFRKSAVAAVMIFGASLSVQAAPLGFGPLVTDNGVTLVRDGCGPFGHRSHYGYCKQNGDEGGGGYYGGGYGDGYRFGPRRGFYGDGDDGEPRCFVRETFYGPRRFCR